MISGAVCGTVGRDSGVLLGAETGYRVVTDYRHQPTQNHALAWTSALVAAEQANSEWCVVLEDDAIPSPDWETSVERLLREAPTDVVGLYLGTGVPASRQGAISASIDQASWLIGRTVLSHVALACRRELVPDFIFELSARPNMPCDTVLDLHVRRRGIMVGYPTRSPFDHADGATTVRHMDPTALDAPRRAWRHSDETFDGPWMPLDRAGERWLRVNNRTV